MQLVKFDSAEIEARQEQLREYKYNIKNLLQELDSNLQSLIFDTQNVINDLCFSSPVRSSDDGALGKINYVLEQMPKRISYVDATLARVNCTLSHWQNVAEDLSAKIEALDGVIQPWETRLDDAQCELAALPDGSLVTYTVTDSDGSIKIETEWYDPYAAERASLHAKIDSIQNSLMSLRQERDCLQSKLNTAKRNCAIAQSDISKLNSFLSRGNAILSTAKKDETHIKQALESLSGIIASLKKYKEKLNKFNEGVLESTKKADKIFDNIAAAIDKLKAISYKHISDFKNGPMKVKFDIDECKKYKNNGDEFNEDVGKLAQYIVRNISDIPDWNDNNKTQAMETILSHAETMKYIVQFYDNEMDFLKKQIAILTDYYNAIE